MTKYNEPGELARPANDMEILVFLGEEHQMLSIKAEDFDKTIDVGVAFQIAFIYFEMDTIIGHFGHSRFLWFRKAGK
jgi:hypothetical protein